MICKIIITLILTFITYWIINWFKKKDSRDQKRVEMLSEDKKLIVADFQVLDELWQKVDSSPFPTVDSDTDVLEQNIVHCVHDMTMQKRLKEILKHAYIYQDEEIKDKLKKFDELFEEIKRDTCCEPIEYPKWIQQDIKEFYEIIPDLKKLISQERTKF